MIEEVDVLVIGAGPSGAIAAAYLNKQGVNVKVVERTKFPRLVIGESLIPKVMENLDAVDLIPVLEKQGYEKKLSSRFLRDGVDCTFFFDDKFGDGWDWTWQVPRADFDKVITDELERRGVEINFQTEVTAVEFEGSDSLTTVKDLTTGKESQIRAKFIIDSSGYGRVLPRLMNLDAPSIVTGKSSIFAHTKDVNRPAGKEGTQITFEVIEREIWFWVIPFSTGTTSIGVVGKTELIEALSPTQNADEALRTIINRTDHFRDRFIDNELLFDPVMLRNYSCSVKEQCGEGYVLTGNSLGFLDPVFSSGVSIATTSGLLAAQLITRQLNGEKVDWQKEYADYMQAGIDVFATYVNEWYSGNLQKLFFHQPANPDIKRKICDVLAGYVWNQDNPCVTKHKNIIKNLAYMIDMGVEYKDENI